MSRIDTTSWVFSAAIVAVGLPLLAGAGLGLTVFIGVVLGPSSLVRAVAPWEVWLVGFVIAVVMMWFVMRFAFRRGGWKSLGTGLAASALIGVVCWFIGELFPPSATHPMAGVGWGILAVFVAAYTLVAAFVGLGVGAVETGRRARSEMEETS